ncbi:hypothetical protein BN2475_2210001 [Paraburkholderia ribeironis]|uniref:Uncharacterized protein n=1 Tax=Paraburkholderia ribeironis TaxID=1247936 RepID=A0A1N7SR73_9BURK|nr:hypothetical protein BN2475_2210001 [Paraburkholderia ribeironis]
MAGVGAFNAYSDPCLPTDLICELISLRDLRLSIERIV